MTGQTSLFPPEPAPDPLLCWLWLAQVMGPASLHAGKVLDAFGGAQEAWEARETEEFRQAAGDTAFKRAAQLDAESFHTLVMQCDALRVRILPFDDPQKRKREPCKRGTERGSHPQRYNHKRCKRISS